MLISLLADKTHSWKVYCRIRAEKILLAIMFHPVFLCGLSALCILSAAESHEERQHMNSKLRLEGQPHLHHIFKRDKDLAGQDHCDEVIYDEVCTNGLLQGYANLLQQCNEPRFAEYLQKLCTPNSQGKYCGYVDILSLRANIEKACHVPRSTCSQECEEILTNVRNELGCCVATLNDTTDPFSYSLWKRCSIENVSEPCQAESTITMTSLEQDPLCDGIWSSIYLRRLYSSIICRKQYVEELRDRLRGMQGCEDHVLIQDLQDVCRANAAGQHCEAELSMFSQATMASASCGDASECNSDCAMALGSIADTTGCCFNEEYNSTSNSGVTFDWMSYEFWSECGLKPLEVCEEKLTSHAAAGLQPHHSTTLLLFVLSLIQTLQ